MTRSIMFRVDGLPAAQGSKRHVGNGIMIESSKAVKPWRQDVVAAAVAESENQEHWHPFTDVVRVDATFYFPRPKSHYGTGKNAAVLKPNAPKYVGKKPDIDKIQRSTFDALGTAGIYRDDSLIAKVNVSKEFAERPGALIRVAEITE